MRARQCWERVEREQQHPRGQPVEGWRRLEVSSRFTALGLFHGGTQESSVRGHRRSQQRNGCRSRLAGKSYRLLTDFMV